jgi:hypothetical protein
MPIIPATWEAAIGGLLETRSLRTVWTTEQDSVSKKVPTKLIFHLRKVKIMSDRGISQ